jgi:hypothetical protein
MTKFRNRQADESGASLDAPNSAWEAANEYGWLFAALLATLFMISRPMVRVSEVDTTNDSSTTYL